MPRDGLREPIRVYMSFPHTPPLPAPNCVAVDETNVHSTTGGIGNYGYGARPTVAARS